MHGLVHRHLHKQRKQNPTTTKRSSAWSLIIEKVTIITGVIGPAMVLPQIFKIYYHHNAAGVSSLSWLAFGILDIPFILYGTLHKDRPIITTYSLWLIANLIVAIGAVMYG